jgi:hypothetical protein
MIREFTLDTPESVRKALHIKAETQDHFVLADSMADLGRGAPGIAPAEAYERDSRQGNGMATPRSMKLASWPSMAM